jgi:hypothetical protein
MLCISPDRVPEKPLLHLLDPDFLLRLHQNSVSGTPWEGVPKFPSFDDF